MKEATTTKTNDRDSIRVLIVEDSSLTAQQLCELIRGVNPRIECSVVATEADAISACAQDITPHVVVLDLHLREGSGFGVLKKLKPLRPRPIVVVLTNYALPQYRDFAMLAGADYFLDKAVSMDELPAVMKSLMRLH